MTIENVEQLSAVSKRPEDGIDNKVNATQLPWIIC